MNASDYETYQDYKKEVQTTAKRYYNYALEGGEEIRTPAYDPDGEIPDDVPNHAIVEAAIENHRLLQYYQRTVIHYCDNGFYDEGGDLYWHEPEDQTEGMAQLARAALYNDVMYQVRHIEETREALGEAIELIEGSIYSMGVILEYEYKGLLGNKDSRTYRFESLGECEWKVYDPNDEAFEVISPHVAVDNRETYVREYALKSYLDGLCARREREINPQ